jgi:hypothetical protein
MSGTPSQADLFGAPTAPPGNPLLGLSVRLPDTCSKCGESVAVIGPGKAQHKASVSCKSCGFFRGWISFESYNFIAAITCKFGAPTTPILIRRGRAEMTS